MPPTRILLIRHAPSAWNDAGRRIGWADIPLTDAGEDLARRAGASLALDEIDAVVASDLQRAVRTAELLAARRPELLPVRQYPALRERDFGRLTGMTHHEAEQSLAGRSRRHAGVEPATAFAERVRTGLGQISEHYPGRTVVAVSHSGPLRRLDHCEGRPSPRCAHLSGRWVTVEPGTIHLGPVVTLVDPAEVERVRERRLTAATTAPSV